MIAKLCRFVAPLLVVLSTSSAHATEDWWFDVEVIVFDRNMGIDDLAEQFKAPSKLTPAVADLNLIDQYLRPNISFLKQGLAVCGKPQSPLWMDKPSLEDITKQYQQWQLSQINGIAGAEADVSDTQQGNPILDSVEGNSINEELLSSLATDEPPEPQELTEIDTDSTEVDDIPIVPPVLAEDIASYWVAFSGINDFSPVSVPSFSFCEPDTPWMQIDHMTQQWQIAKPNNSLPAPKHIPEFLDGRDWPRSSSAHLLPYDALELTDLSRQIRQTRGLNRLLHIAWRQPVKFGEESAYTMRISAGDNYAALFDIDGKPLPVENSTSQPVSPSADAMGEDPELTLQQNDFFAELNAALEETTPLSLQDITESNLEVTEVKKSVAQAKEGDNLAIWQLDGYLKVYLKYINRVPYLHIDSDMQYRSPSTHAAADAGSGTETVLKSVPFTQKRRVISKQIHYFDHPLFGMVVVIRRHQRPAATE